MRLRKIAERFPDEVAVKWRPFALRPYAPAEAFAFEGSYVERGWQSAAAMTQADGIRYRMWDRGPLPRWSMPGLWAGAAAQRQGEELFHRFHLGLFEAFFSQSLDPTAAETVIDLAREAGLDAKQFQADLEDPALRDQVKADASRSAFEDKVQAAPTVMIGGRYRLQGAVPEQHYLNALAQCGLTAAQSTSPAEGIVASGWAQLEQ